MMHPTAVVGRGIRKATVAAVLSRIDIFLRDMLSPLHCQGTGDGAASNFLPSSVPSLMYTPPQLNNSFPSQPFLVGRKVGLCIENFQVSGSLPMLSIPKNGSNPPFVQ